MALTLGATGTDSLVMDGPAVDPLAVRIADGDVDAVAEAYELHHAAVRAFARRLVGDEAVAEDLVHEVFVTLPSAIRSFRSESTLRTFLVSIAVNHARHHVRAAGRRRAAMAKLSVHPPPPAPPTPEEDVARRRLALRLSRALDELPVDQRVAFVLCEVEERPAAEVSAIVSAPEATVRTRLFHAKRKLREILQKEALG
ncbi:MAG TPA: RNA polymerase sigma factor [Polyangiaceae bacterium]|nr:RNA polymerase sigma factor [Polyangiaceae bacterium]